MLEPRMLLSALDSSRRFGEHRPRDRVASREVTVVDTGIERLNSSRPIILSRLNPAQGTGREAEYVEHKLPGEQAASGDRSREDIP